MSIDRLNNSPSPSSKPTPTLEEQKKYFHRALLGRKIMVAVSNAFRNIKAFFGGKQNVAGESGVSKAWFNKVTYNPGVDGLSHDSKIKNLAGKTLYLGMIPDDVKKRQIPENIHAVSVLMDFEADCMDDSLKTKEKRHVVNAVDNIGMSPENISKGVDALQEAMTSGDKDHVYIHCKSGVGRSATVLAAWLIEHRGYTFDGAIRRVQADRPDAQLRTSSGKNTKHTQALKEWYQKRQEKQLDALSMVAEGTVIDGEPSLMSIGIPLD